MKEISENEWYPLRVPYGRELKLKALLNTLQVMIFIPMQHKKTTVRNRETIVVVPAIRNLIFVYSNKPFLSDLKLKTEESIPFRYIMDRATKSPITVPTKEMEHFIAVAGTMNEQLIYLTEINPTLRGGDRVLVTEGVFEGVEGTVVRIKKDRRVMVSIDGVAAVVTAYINPLLLKKTDPQTSPNQ